MIDLDAFKDMKPRSILKFFSTLGYKVEKPKYGSKGYIEFPGVEYSKYTLGSLTLKGKGYEVKYYEVSDKYFLYITYHMVTHVFTTRRPIIYLFYSPSSLRVIIE